MMRLSRHSHLVRYWLWAKFERSEQERAEALAKGTNVCAFVRELVLYSLLQCMLGVMIAVCVPIGVVLTWTIIAVSVLYALIVGYTPNGFDPKFRQMSFWWWAPSAAIELQWRRNAGLRIGSRTFYAYHVIIPLMLYGLIRLEVVGWTQWAHHMEHRQPWLFVHGLVAFAATIFGGALAIAWWRSTDTRRVFRAWLQAKKDRVCPRITFVE